MTLHSPLDDSVINAYYRYIRIYIHRLVYKQGNSWTSWTSVQGWTCVGLVFIGTNTLARKVGRSDWVRHVQEISPFILKTTLVLTLPMWDTWCWLNSQVTPWKYNTVSTLLVFKLVALMSWLPVDPTNVVPRFVPYVTFQTKLSNKDFSMLKTYNLLRRTD